ncbi:MAG TPA: hypothetical protein PKW29_13610, partial [Clostridia bacterium]|nr:hypothetical protein [Clostridia bacterium]
ISVAATSFMQFSFNSSFFAMKSPFHLVYLYKSPLAETSERRGAWVIYVKTFTFFMLYYYCKHTIINKKEVIIMKKWVVED